MIALNLTDEGEGILLGRPIYGSFFGDLTTRSRYDSSFPSEAYEHADRVKMQTHLHSF
jgi:hypothetical protein